VEEVLTRARPDAIFVMRYPGNYANRQVIADFVVVQRMPGMYPFREIVDAGGRAAGQEIFASGW